MKQTIVWNGDMYIAKNAVVNFQLDQNSKKYSYSFADYLSGKMSDELINDINYTMGKESITAVIDAVDENDFITSMTFATCS